MSGTSPCSAWAGPSPRPSGWDQSKPGTGRAHYAYQVVYGGGGGVGGLPPQMLVATPATVVAGVANPDKYTRVSRPLLDKTVKNGKNGKNGKNSQFRPAWEGVWEGQKWPFLAISGPKGQKPALITLAGTVLAPFSPFLTVFDCFLTLFHLQNTLFYFSA